MRLAALLIAAIVLAGCSTPAAETGAPTVTTPPMAPSAEPSAQAPASSSPSGNDLPVAQLNVTMLDHAFSPAKIIVPQGATVTWTNAGTRAHTIALDDGSFTSGTMPPGETAARAFDAPGSVGYHCDIHPGMKGTVIVNATGAPPVPPGIDPTPPPPAPAPGVFFVNLTAMSFSPNVLRVPANSTVEFLNADNVPHTVTTDFSLFDSGPMQPGARFNVTLVRPMTVHYHCTFHDSGMRAQIVVE